MQRSPAIGIIIEAGSRQNYESLTCKRQPLIQKVKFKF